MHKFSCLLLSTLIAFESFAQDEEYKEPSQASHDYHSYRLYESTPPFGLEKVKTLIKKNTKYTESEEFDGGTKALDKKTFNSLSLREKFTYTMIHGENWSQNCDVNLPEVDEEKKIFSHLPDILGEDSWSDRQTKFLTDNRDSVMAIIKESAIRSKRMGLNYKKTIEEINGTELIPFLISFYNEKKKDGDILALLNLLMRKNKYEPFMISQSYEKLYKGSDYMAFIVYNKANEELIIQRATQFYNARAKK